MGQKVNPIGFRTGIMLGWKSRWYASKKEFADLLMEDQKIRKFVHTKYKFAGIPKVEIERTRDEVKVILHAARPGARGMAHIIKKRMAHIKISIE